MRLLVQVIKTCSQIIQISTNHRLPVLMTFLLSMAGGRGRKLILQKQASRTKVWYLQATLI